MELNVSFVEANRTFSVEFGEFIDISIGDYDTGYQHGYADGDHEGFWRGWYEGYDTGCVEATNDATATANHIDYGQTAYVKGNKITGIKHRREYSGTITDPVVGATVYVTLLQDDLLKEIRMLDTLFVRVECAFDEPIANTIVRTWASNKSCGVMPANYTQLVLRWDSEAANNASGNSLTLYSDTVGGYVGQLYITEDTEDTEGGKLLFYSGSYGTYYIRPCTFKVIVEW